MHDFVEGDEMIEAVLARRQELRMGKAAFHRYLARKRPGSVGHPNIFSRVIRLENDERGRPRFRLETSRLPQITPDGHDVDPSWFKTDKGWYTRINCGLAAHVTEKGVLVASQGKIARWSPVLLVGGKRYDPLGPPEIIDDPDNENYHANCLSWDYGICERRIRVIEGRLREWWIFPENPHSTIRIRHNLRGDLDIRLGGGWSENPEDPPLECEVEGDVEVVRKEVLEGIRGPFRVGASATYYPDANPESTSVDGWVTYVSQYSTWATVHDGPGSSSNDGTPQFSYAAMIKADNVEWTQIYRGIMLFDTSGLPDNAVISAATFSIYGDYKYNSFTGNSFALNVYASNPASNTALASGDYDSLGTVAFSDSPISYADYNDAGYNDFTLNSSGINAISKTGITKLGTRESNYDAPDTEPTWESEAYVRFSCSNAERGAGYQPKLVVEYTLPSQRVRGVFIF